MRLTNRSTVLIAALIGVAACEKNAPTAAPPTAGRPAPGFVVVPASLGTALPSLDAAQRSRFDAGRVVFTTVFTPPTGLGPLFNSVSCASCHEQPVVGGSGNNDPAEGGEDVEVHATAFQGVPTGRRTVAWGGSVARRRSQRCASSIRTRSSWRWASPIPAIRQNRPSAGCRSRPA